MMSLFGLRGMTPFYLYILATFVVSKFLMPDYEALHTKEQELADTDQALAASALLGITKNGGETEGEAEDGVGGEERGEGGAADPVAAATAADAAAAAAAAAAVAVLPPSAVTAVVNCSA